MKYNTIKISSVNIKDASIRILDVTRHVSFPAFLSFMWRFNPKHVWCASLHNALSWYTNSLNIDNAIRKINKPSDLDLSDQEA